MKLRRVADGGEFEVDILGIEGSTVRARVDGIDFAVSFERIGDGVAIVTVGGRRYRVFGAAVRDRILVTVGPMGFEFARVEPELTAPMPGKVLRILVKEGDEVEAGAGLLVLEAMKMETTLYAETPARVKRVLVEEGQMVDHGAVLIELSPAHAPSHPESGPPG
jgi:acetyl/propionyl-CoA carboxylase alpha subunit